MRKKCMYMYVFLFFKAHDRILHLEYWVYKIELDSSKKYMRREKLMNHSSNDNTLVTCVD